MFHILEAATEKERSTHSEQKLSRGPLGPALEADSYNQKGVRLLMGLKNKSLKFIIK